ncbi:MAG TPA: hypothetical protein VJ623_01240 [Holophagaceae bacterium]|nr:hypothetical protein [Holophagaceae bacterium]
MSASTPSTPFRQGQYVRVKSEAEIATTLAGGKLEGIPFMPEMARYCGRTFRIHRRAMKTCVEGHSLRSLKGTLLLEDLRCRGEFHDGCQRNCRFFWKEAWLAPVPPPGEGDAPRPPASDAGSAWTGGLPTREGDRYLCQSTELFNATGQLSRWNVTHFISEIRAGELSIPAFLHILRDTLLDRVGRALGLGRKGVPRGWAREAPSRGGLDLKAGEWVEVKSVDEIRRTLDAEGKHRGLSFEPDMVDFTGQRFEVEFPVRNIILEQTGKMIHLEHTVALKGVACHGTCAMNCPRNNTLYWREIWLRRAGKA